MNRIIELAELIKMMRESLLCEEKSLVIFFIKFANIILETNTPVDIQYYKDYKKYLK